MLPAKRSAWRLVRNSCMWRADSFSSRQVPSPGDQMPTDDLVVAVERGRAGAIARLDVPQPLDQPLLNVPGLGGQVDTGTARALGVVGVAGDTAWSLGSAIWPIQVQPPHSGHPVDIASERSAGSSRSGSQVCSQVVQTRTTETAPARSRSLITRRALTAAHPYPQGRADQRDPAVAEQLRRHPRFAAPVAGPRRPRSMGPRPVPSRLPRRRGRRAVGP